MVVTVQTHICSLPQSSFYYFFSIFRISMINYGAYFYLCDTYILTKQLHNKQHVLVKVFDCQYLDRINTLIKLY